MKDLKGLKICVNQMPVIPGRPDLNAQYMIEHIHLAEKDGVDILAFPEMCVPGYLIGDLFENESFVADVSRYNRQIEKAVPDSLTVIYGTLLCNPDLRNEDGRWRKYNGAVIVNDGKVLDRITKTLQPNYRMFDDDRHFYSNRKIKENVEINQRTDNDLEDFLEPIEVSTRIGLISLGAILCEDMWHKDYNINPTKVLVDKGADLVFNLSASPWTWQKNRKRHQVVRELLQISPVPFVYVNNTGMQNNGKNLIVFDGSSTVYSQEGNILFAVTPYSTSNHSYVFSDDLKTLAANEPTISTLAERIRYDAKELYEGWECAVRQAFANLPLSMRKAVIGLSGGIDSAVDAALLAKILGPENVYAINMPSHYNSQTTKDIAKRIAENLGINYEIRPINGIVEALCKATGTLEDTLSYENIQARTRQEILAARSQDLGAVFICNSNKIEMAFGYGTLYGDIAGFIAPLGDMLKYEVYQMGNYLNEVVYEKEVIPTECFHLAPSAELKDKQTDPFQYGSLSRRGYHDELVRAFTEFRRDPEWILQHFIQGTLEDELRLDPGTLAELFLDPIDFVADLEKNYRCFIISFFKRNQAPPIPILSKRSFGYDLRESMLSPFFTGRYYDLKKYIVSRSDKRRSRIAIYGGSFNPACRHHQQIAQELSKKFDKVIIVPCGSNRSDKDSVKVIDNIRRAKIAKLAFEGIKNVELDLFDLENNIFTPTYLLQQRYETKYPHAEIWHVVGSDLVIWGKDSEIQRSWQHGKEIWDDFNFFIIIRPGFEATLDLPPNHKVHKIPGIFGSGTMIRNMIKAGEDASEFLDEDVYRYIKENTLYSN